MNFRFECFVSGYRLLLLVMVLVLVGGLSGKAQTLPATQPFFKDHQDNDLELVYWDGPMENGQLTGGRAFLPRPDLSNIRGVDGGYETIIDNGPPSNRIDIVTVGDGYLSNQLGTYNTNVVNAINDLFDIEPFATYASLFNVHRVDVVSPESGVDHDPTYPIWRNTELNMGFFCNGIERLLCVDVGRAYSYANNAPDVDQVLAVANSTKYGGAGYTSSDLATFSGSNGSSTQVAIHELGHSLGNLADEYDYGGPDTYNGPERPEPNVSIFDSDEMYERGTKWAAWLGYNDPQYDGLVSTYEGAYYSRFGIYRPSNNSMMRSLNRPFNLPSVEALVIEFYKIVNPIDDSTPQNEVLNGSSVVWVDVVDPVGAPLDIQWYLDDQPIPGANSDTLDLSAVEMSEGTYQLSVSVVDNTWFVRNEVARSQWMTDTRQWTVQVELGVCAASGLLIEGTGEINDINAACGSDDLYWAGHGEVFAFQVSDPVVQFELTAPAPAGFEGGTMSVDIEASQQSDNANLNLRALMFNFTTGSYVILPGIMGLTTTDAVQNFELPAGSDPADFIDGNNDVQLLLQTIQTSGLPNVRTQLDEVLFTFE